VTKCKEHKYAKEFESNRKSNKIVAASDHNQNMTIGFTSCRFSPLWSNRGATNQLSKGARAKNGKKHSQQDQKKIPNREA
jgi:hypothetical protein